MGSSERLTLDEMVKLAKLVNNWRCMLFDSNVYRGSIEDITLEIEFEEPTWQHVCRSAYRFSINQGNIQIGEYIGRRTNVQEVYFHAQYTASKKGIENVRRILQNQQQNEK